jgi:hypothetical protein
MTPIDRPQLDRHRERGAERQAAARRRERPALEAFRAFREGLPEDRPFIYMFFTSGLLHWMERALSFVPEGVPVVLLGSALEDDEIAHVGGLGRPFHAFTERLDDNAVLDFLFTVETRSFAWLHIDCFVFDPGLFEEMTTFGPEDALTTIWTHPGADTLHSAFVGVHHEVRATLAERGLDVSPMTYHYEGDDTGRTFDGEPLYSLVPPPEVVERLAAVLPPEEEGNLPAYPVGQSFEILEVYQLVARAEGYRARRVRDLIRDGNLSDRYYSDDVIHVNGVSTYRRYPQGGSYIDSAEYRLLLMADYAILSAMVRAGRVPASYARLHRELGDEVAELGLSDDAVAAHLAGFLMQRGVSPVNCARILGVDAASLAAGVAG